MAGTADRTVPAGGESRGQGGPLAGGAGRADVQLDLAGVVFVQQPAARPSASPVAALPEAAPTVIR